MSDLPSGVVTFMMSDVEGSTALWERDPQGTRAAIAEHDRLIANEVAIHDGWLLKERGEGDSWFSVFTSPEDAAAAAAAIQLALAADGRLRARLGIHTGEADVSDGTYYGVEVNRCARIRSAGHGGQVLVSGATAARLPATSILRDLGEHRLRGVTAPERIFQLEIPGLAGDFPPLVTVDLVERLRQYLRIGAAPGAPTDADVSVAVGLGDNGSCQLQVSRDGVVVERFDDLTVGGSTDVVQVVNARSRLIRVELGDVIDG